MFEVVLAYLQAQGPIFKNVHETFAFHVTRLGILCYSKNLLHFKH